MQHINPKLFRLLQICIFALLLAGAISSSCLYYFVSTKDQPEEIRFLSQEELVNIKGMQAETVVEDTIIVDIAGQINQPGVIELQSGINLFEAINQAGGFTPSADMYYVQKNLNLSEIVVDRQKIYIPSMEEQQVSGRAESSGLININEASIEELDSLPGIGPATAEKIIQSRPYASIDDIKNVSGIGESTFEKLKDKIQV